MSPSNPQMLEVAFPSRETDWDTGMGLTRQSFTPGWSFFIKRRIWKPQFVVNMQSPARKTSETKFSSDSSE